MSKSISHFQSYHSYLPLLPYADANTCHVHTIPSWINPLIVPGHSARAPPTPILLTTNLLHSNPPLNLFPSACSLVHRSHMTSVLVSLLIDLYQAILDYYYIMVSDKSVLVVVDDDDHDDDNQRRMRIQVGSRCFSSSWLRCPWTHRRPSSYQRSHLNKLGSPHTNLGKIALSCITLDVFGN